MANLRDLKRLESALSRRERTDWNRWRWEKTIEDGIFGTHPAKVVNLSNVDLRKPGGWQEQRLAGFDFTRANLRGVQLQETFLLSTCFRRSDLRDAHFERADLRRTFFTGADLRGAHLDSAILAGADFAHADLRGAHLQDADLSRAIMVNTKLQGANLNGCTVYGTSVWDVRTDDSTQQQNLRITPNHETWGDVGLV